MSPEQGAKKAAVEGHNACAITSSLTGPTENPSGSMMQERSQNLRTKHLLFSFQRESRIAKHILAKLSERFMGYGVSLSQLRGHVAIPLQQCAKVHISIGHSQCLVWLTGHKDFTALVDKDLAADSPRIAAIQAKHALTFTLLHVLLNANVLESAAATISHDRHKFSKLFRAWMGDQQSNVINPSRNRDFTFCVAIIQQTSGGTKVTQILMQAIQKKRKTHLETQVRKRATRRSPRGGMDHFRASTNSKPSSAHGITQSLNNMRGQTSNLLATQGADQFQHVFLPLRVICHGLNKSAGCRRRLAQNDLPKHRVKRILSVNK